jgi:hypothetical protein
VIRHAPVAPGAFEYLVLHRPVHGAAGVDGIAALIWSPSLGGYDVPDPQTLNPYPWARPSAVEVPWLIC